MILMKLFAMTFPCACAFFAVGALASFYALLQSVSLPVTLVQALIESQVSNACHEGLVRIFTS
jgi:hypothetical protein